MKEESKYWTGLEELHNTEEFVQARDNEFPSEVPVEDFVAESSEGESSSGRRDFLKYLGFSVGAATLAACETPVTRVIPYVNKPEQVMPGMPTYYASTYFDGMDYASVLVKTREGRPIFIKGNKDFGYGAVNSRINASVLSLYDSTRLRGPMIGKEGITWSAADTAITKSLEQANGNGGEVVFLTESISSPSTLKALNALKNKYPSAQVSHVQYDALSYEAIRKANESVSGKAVIPFMDFSRAKVVVSVAADFMNDFPLSAQYTAAYGTRRKPDGPWMSKHFQFESIMSLAGSNADYRQAIKPSEEGKILASIYGQITGSGGGEYAEMTKSAADALKSAKGSSLVLAGSNDVNVQMIASAINKELNNIGTTVKLDRPVRISNGNTAAFTDLMSRMNAGRVKMLFIHGVNPAYDSPKADEFISGLAKVGTSVSFSMHADETGSRCNMMLPDNHALESWNDYNVVGTQHALAQPTISPLFDTRQYQDGILKWADVSSSYLDFIQSSWSDLATRAGSTATSFWNKSLHNGSVDVASAPAVVADLDSEASESIEAPVSGTSISSALSAVNSAKSGDIEVKFYTKTGIGTGNSATNPWLQELPDPITKVCWDNYIAMSPADVKENGFNMHLGEMKPASLATVEVNGKSLTLPVVVVPGQKSGTIGIALGYGRGANGEEIGKAAFKTKEYGGYSLDAEGGKEPIGGNAYPLISMIGGLCSYNGTGASVAGTGVTYPMAATQTHHTVMGRESILKETDLNTYKTGDSHMYNHPHMLEMHEDGKAIKKPISEVDLWDEHPVEDIGHWWGLSIDLSSCFGCGACITACHTENNVPVVGKDEVRKARDMHWLRIDRYFSSEATREDGYSAMEIPSDNPSVVHMPMMCQHCNHAPCETVCPVAATTHSNEGINQMTYNRCIGTRYCANNCPYKVRRFNWFNYKAYGKFSEVNPSQDIVGRMVLNPDVTVRSRGVMEKCSMCMQRIQAGKLDAKINGIPVPDGAIQTACSEACPSNAITFGDMNDKGSSISKSKDDSRSYMALEEVGTKPSISYLVKVRNREEIKA